MKLGYGLIEIKGRDRTWPWSPAISRRAVEPLLGREWRSPICSNVSNPEEVSLPTFYPLHFNHRENFINLSVPPVGKAVSADLGEYESFGKSGTEKGHEWSRDRGGRRGRERRENVQSMHTNRLMTTRITPVPISGGASLIWSELALEVEKFQEGRSKKT